MPARNPCTYRRGYADIGSKELLEYSCPRDALPGAGYCELHSPEFWKSDPGLSIAALGEELERAPGSAARACVGFHLPDVDLSDRRFGGAAYFQYTAFHGRAVFENAVFEKGASFRECAFEGQASFERARFGGDADFFGMKAGKMSFAKARFSSPVLLSACAVSECDFRYAEFSEVLIRKSEFGEADFGGARFGGHCDLTESSFGGATFRGARFAAATISSVEFREKADFGLASFESPKDVRFNSDLTRVSFLEADLSRVRFGGATEWNFGAEMIPYDVREFRTDSGKKHFDDVLSVLRDLRDNYEYYLEYEGAGKLFVQEMEMRRRYKDTGGGVEMRPGYWRLLSLTGFYSHLCRYGESFRRPALWMSLLFGASVLFFWWDAGFADKGTCPLADSNKWSYALTRTLAGVLHWGCQEIPDYALRAASIPILGTTFVVLRRRFERRFRH